jgi:hypothetical protein
MRTKYLYLVKKKVGCSREIIYFHFNFVFLDNFLPLSCKKKKVGCSREIIYFHFNFVFLDNFLRFFGLINYYFLSFKGVY